MMSSNSFQVLLKSATHLVVIMTMLQSCNGVESSNKTEKSSCPPKNSSKNISSDKIYWNDSPNPTGAPRWANGAINWYYNPSGQPAIYSTDYILAALVQNMAKWEKVCKIKWTYKGITTRSARSNGDGYPVVGWGDSGGNYGYTDVRWDRNKYFTDSDIELNPNYLTDRDNFLGTVTHEADRRFKARIAST